MAFEIVREFTKFNQKYRISRQSVCFKLAKLPSDVTSPELWVRNGIKDIVEHITQNVDPDDRIGFTLSSNLFGKGDAHIPFRKSKNVTFDDVWELLGQLYQSNSEGFHSDNFFMTATVAKPYRGKGRSASSLTYDDECRKRRGVVVIHNKDNLCLARALVVAMAYVMNSPYFKQIRQNIGKRQNQEVQKLLSDTGITIPPTGAGFEEIQQFQRHLKNFKISVFRYGTKGRELLFEGPDAVHKINLLHHNSHYNVITSLPSAFGCGYYCEACHVPYNNKHGHRCDSSCPCCQQSPPCEKTSEETTCSDCHRKFRGHECYSKHKLLGSSGETTVCQRVRRCIDCLKTVLSNREHKCGEIYCKICAKHHLVGEFCYMQQNISKPPTGNFAFVFYDLECTQDEVDPTGATLHTPNLCVLQQRCQNCIDEERLYFCQKCGFRQKIIEKDIIPAFIRYLLELKKKFGTIVVIAHNGRGYDHQFVLRHLIEKCDLKVDVIMRGTNVIMMKVGGIKFIDSLNYFPMPLSSLPEAFGLGPELKKGYFPYFFNSEANRRYIGPLPGIEFYGVDNMKDSDRIKFLQWYQEHKGDIFELKKELIDYCVSDVDILTKACLRFRQMFLEQCNVCPFMEATTIASACNLVFRRNFLKPNTIGLIPRNGYRGADNQSKIATLWLLHEESQRGIDIIHSAKQREVVLHGIRVDGFSSTSKQVFFFHGCFWHGHFCLTAKRDDPLQEDPSDTLNTRYERTLKTTERLRQRGYQVIEMWECDFRIMLKQNKQLQKDLNSNALIANLPLSPRDAFYGGRTGNCRTYYKCKQGEKIKYTDICSLYPWVCKNSKFPIGHPTVHVGNACRNLNINTTEGLIKCRILPPTNLYHPVLPVKMNKKLMFLLCRTCGETLNQDDCNHTEEERALSGVYVIDEVRKALEKGYKIIDVYEIWEYNVTQYDKRTNTEGLFTAMVNKFLKTKQEASGWPSSCVTEDQKNAYIEEFLNREDVQLEYSKIVKNPGLRSLAKLILNSFWGKFGQRENMQKTSIINQVSELERLLADPAITVKHIEEINEDVQIVCWEYKEEAADLLSTVNVCIAAYTTAMARLKLYSYLEKLGDRVLYYDTDSVIYVSRDQEEEDIPTGEFLGDMTNELESFGKGAYILFFSSCGPKNYSFMVFSPHYHTYFTICKVKGIRLDHTANQLVNFYTMRNIVMSEEPPEPVFVKTAKIQRTKQHQVVTKDESKIYRPCSEKRKFCDDYDSIPYGYKKARPDSS